MKDYNSIPHWNKGIWGEHIYAFNKIDGSQIRVEWTKKNSWHKFGSKYVLLHPDQKPLYNAIELFVNKYAEKLERIITDDKDLRKSLKYTAFLEFFGEKSFGGQHEENDKFDIVLFDICQYQKGIMKPNDFIKKFDSVEIPDVVHIGNYNKEFVDKIKYNALEDYPLKEGVVCKGIRETKRKNIDQIWMCKIKTYEWLNKVKEKLGQETFELECNNDIEIIKDLNEMEIMKPDKQKHKQVNPPFTSILLQ